MKSKIIFLVFLVIIVSPGAAVIAGSCDGAWKWIDNTGKTRYSGTPPDYAKSQAVCLKPVQTQWTEEYNAGLKKDRINRIKAKQIAQEKENQRLAVIAAKEAKVNNTRNVEDKKRKKYRKKMADAMDAVHDARSDAKRFQALMEVKMLRKNHLAEYGIAEKEERQPNTIQPVNKTVIHNGMSYPVNGGGFTDINGVYHVDTGGSFFNIQTGQFEPTF